MVGPAGAHSAWCGEIGGGSDWGRGARWTLCNAEEHQVQVRHDQAAPPVENEKRRAKKEWRVDEINAESANNGASNDCQQQRLTLN